MILVIGLDGATWDLIDPWMAEGRLPNLERLRRAGWSGPLASTMPPATLPSWSTFMTGVNPGKHGIFDFTRRRLGTYEVEFVNATFRKSPSIWRLLSDAGQRVCVLGLPGTYPPEALNGCMVSGFDSPVTTRADASFVSPPALAPLVMELGGFPFADFQEFRVSRKWYRMALDRLLRGIEGKTRLATTLLRRDAWQCFMLLFGESDTVAHHYWKFLDPQSPRFDAEGAGEFGNAIRRVYEALDASIGSLTATVPEATVMVVSDHGFGGAGNKVVYLNRWLAEQGLQQTRTTRMPTSPGAGLRWLALAALPASLQARAFRLGGGRWANRLESRSRFGNIDWARTVAFSEELNYFPSLWLNLKGREPQGYVGMNDYERVRDELCAAVTGLQDPEHGGPIVRRAWRREELYHGPWVKYAPDVVLEFHLDGRYSYTCLSSRTAPNRAAVRVLEAHECAGGKLAGLNGSHRADGMFVLAPSGATAGRRHNARIADMAATILALCGLRPPADFDGQTLDLVMGSSRGSTETHAVDGCEQYYGRADEEEIAARLSALGYL
jgi:predicted AlkP superfamily phosphohydrolase/phosphomutase